MRVAAAVPFKRFTAAKQRLRTRYSDSEVEEIGRAMLMDVLSALCAAESLERVVVLTEDAEVAALATQEGAAVRVRSPDPGLNPAIEEATEELAAEGFDAVLVVLGDLPLLQTADVDRVVEAGRSHPVVIVPSSDGGTAMLLRRPPRRIPARFGADSAAAHAAEARKRGIEPGAVEGVAEIARVDLDTPDDVDRLLASELPCRTLKVLERLRR